jgi:hypothetical protein
MIANLANGPLRPMSNSPSTLAEQEIQCEQERKHATSGATCLPVFGLIFAGKFQFSGICDSPRSLCRNQTETRPVNAVLYACHPNLHICHWPNDSLGRHVIRSRLTRETGVRAQPMPP